MKRIAGFASLLLGVGLASHALGADLPIRPPPEVIVPVAPTWTGFYVGVNGGWGWTNSNNGNGTLTLTDTVGGALFSPVTIASANHNAESAIFGGQIGYNLQAGSWVFGVEGDVDGADIRGSQAIVFPGSSLLGAGGNGFLTQKQECSPVPVLESAILRIVACSTSLPEELGRMSSLVVAQRSSVLVAILPVHSPLAQPGLAM
jgi:opacity protein-like surface antigen